jgi:hypothetical protein
MDHFGAALGRGFLFAAGGEAFGQTVGYGLNRYARVRRYQRALSLRQARLANKTMSAHFGEMITDGPCGSYALAVDKAISKNTTKLDLVPSAKYNTMRAMASALGYKNPKEMIVQSTYSPNETIQALRKISRGKPGTRFIIGSIDMDLKRGHFFNAVIDNKGRVRLIDGTYSMKQFVEKMRKNDVYHIIKTST